MTSFTELSEQECRALLRTKSVGRIALRLSGVLRILPLSYALSDNAIVFRTLPYGTMSEVAYGEEVAFEVDELDESVHTGWSVVAGGRCRRVEDADEVQALRSTNDPEPWVEGSRSLYYRIDVTELTGRQVGEPRHQVGVAESREVTERDGTTATTAVEAPRSL